LLRSLTTSYLSFCPSLKLRMLARSNCRNVDELVLATVARLNEAKTSL